MADFRKLVTAVLWLSSLYFVSGCENRETLRRDDFPLKPPRHGGVYVIAHRGVHNGIPENSITAYQKAIDLGADFVEIDIRTTRDGHFISIHDSTVDAYVEGITGSVSDFTLAEIRQLDIGTKIGPEWEGTRIPTLDEILGLCKGRIGIYLDLKDAPIPPLVEFIKERGMEKEIVWCLGGRNELRTVAECCADCVLMPDPGDLEEFSLILDEFCPYVVAPVWREFSWEFVQMSHEAGALVFVDEQDETSWPYALEWGADGIQTDHPAELIEYVKNRERK